MIRRDTNRISNDRILTIIYMVIVAALFSVDTPCFGQSQLYLQHRHKPHRQENMLLNKEYIFQTSDSTYNKYHIIAFTEDDLLISSITWKDTLQIPFKDIESVVKVKKFGLIEAIGTLGLVCLTTTPAFWATGRSQEASDMLIISGFLLTVSVPIIAIKRIGRKKDTKSKWTIRVKE